jgi:hypothetical protein
LSRPMNVVYILFCTPSVGFRISVTESELQNIVAYYFEAMSNYATL